MSAASPSNPQKSLLVVRLGAMGDVIHTMYAVGWLRHALPETQIGWVIEERWAELLCAKDAPRSGPRSPARPIVDFLHLVNTKAWRKAPLASGTRQQFSAALKEIRERKYELAIDFQGAIKSALLARLCGAGTVVGMERPREGPARLFYSEPVQTAGSHVIEQFCSLAGAVLRKSDRRASLDWAGMVARAYLASENRAFEFPCDPATDANSLRKLQGISCPMVLINPGAGWGAKQWPAERYGEVAHKLSKEGFLVLVNFGPGEEQLAKDVQEVSDGAAQPITCSVAELIALTRRVSLFIGGDTGPLHLACALGIPIVAIFGPTDPVRNGPYGGKSVILRNSASRTSLSHTSKPDPGLLQIRADEVLSAAHNLLGATHA